MPTQRNKSTVTSQSAVKKLFENAVPCLYMSGVRILSSKTNGQGKILIVASAKVGNAVARNLFKRRVKHIFRKLELFNLPYDFIVLASKRSLVLSFQLLEKVFTNLLTLSR